MSTGSSTSEQDFDLVNPAVDVHNTHEFWQGYDIEPEPFPGSEPVFQKSQSYNGEKWVIRWNKPSRGDPKLDMVRELQKAEELFEPGEVYVETPNRRGYFEADQIDNLAGSLGAGFSIEEVLERGESGSADGSTLYCAVSDSASDRVYQAESVGDEVLVGLEGSSQINEEDLQFIGIEGQSADRLLSQLRSKTSGIRNY